MGSIIPTGLIGEVYLNSKGSGTSVVPGELVYFGRDCGGAGYSSTVIGRIESSPGMSGTSYSVSCYTDVTNSMFEEIKG